jgi:hypothetical protein
MRVVQCAFAALALSLAAPALNAQSPPSQTDSVAAQLRALKARLDSLERAIAALKGQGKDTTQAVDDLASLRAAAQAAVGSDTVKPPPSETQFVGKTRSQPQLNPEISATGDVRVLANHPGPQRNNVDIREFEIALQSPLDPYSSTKIFLTVDEGEVSIEEGYAYWTGLPGHVRLDLGRFRQPFGELNRWHAHELPQSEYPLVVRHFLGGDGLSGDGVSLYWLMPTGGGAFGTHELTGQVTMANNETLFGSGNRIAYLAHLNNFWALSGATFVQLGVSGLYGENPDSLLKTSVAGVDLRVSWRPPLQGSYRSFTLRAEGFAARRATAGAGVTRYGAYTSAQYQVSQRSFLGVRYDYVQPLGGGDAVWAVVPNLTWWQSEWVYLRAEWQHTSTPISTINVRDLALFAPGGNAIDNHFLIQAVWAIGPHKHETY